MSAEALPPGSVLELGNSAVFRYAQFFDPKPGVDCHSNRGVSGIDGSLSAAVGSATASGKLTLCVLGDLSFVYDSNALWNRALPRGLRVAVVNNGGGGIFGLIGAPLETMPHRAFIEAHHPVRIDKLAEAFGLAYFRATGAESLAAALPAFLAPESGPALLEIGTSAEITRGNYRKILGA
jgi:2-succinyl-5-enolpyruvyl-6-hydroxy-3-cyclohexene-1-carboxylate synthase